MSNEKTIMCKCSKCNNYEEIVYNRNSITEENQIMSIDELTLKFSHDKKTVSKMLKILYQCYKNDVADMRKLYSRLDNNNLEENIEEKINYFKNNESVRSETISDLDFYICANLKFIEEAFYFKRCSKCKSLLNVVLVYSV